MAEQSTLLTTLRIDVSPNGIKFTIEGLDRDMAELIGAASKFTVQPIEHHNFDTSNIYIKSDKVLQFVDPPATPTP